VRDVWTEMKKVIIFKIRGDLSDARLDRAIKPIIVSNEISLEQHSAFLFPASRGKKNTNLTFSLDPQLQCHISTVSSCISLHISTHSAWLHAQLSQSTVTV